MGNSTPTSSITREQWVSKVISYSTQYGAVRWSANKIIGKPKVYPHYGDNVGAWTPSSYSQNEHLELEFETPVIPTGLDIYFTLNPNPITRIYFMKGKEWDLVCERTSTQERDNVSVIFKPKLEKVKYLTNAVRIEMDNTGFSYWPEIDCVKLIGDRKVIGTCKPPRKLSPNGKKNLELFKSQSFHDFVLNVQGEEIKVHRYILASRSTFFKELFERNERENKKEVVLTLDPYIENHNLTEEPKSIISLFLIFLYSDYVSLKPKHLLPCFEVSKIFHSLEFEDYVMMYFRRFVDDSNCLKLLVVSKKKKLKRIVKLCYIHLAKHMESVEIENPNAREMLTNDDLKYIDMVKEKIRTGKKE